MGSEGAFSKQVAKVTLTAPLAIDVAKGTAFMGINAEGNQIAGKAYADNAAGATSVMIQYKTTDSQADYVGCQVGASTTPVTDGCFVEAGSMTVAGSVEVSYTYNVLSENIAKRTLQGFSTSAEKKMANCANCPYSMYAKFYDYYGEYDYANQIVGRIRRRSDIPQKLQQRFPSLQFQWKGTNHQEGNRLHG